MEIKVYLDLTPFLVTTIVLGILKAFNVINWAWYWIISPLIFYIILVIVVLIIFKIKGWL